MQTNYATSNYTAQQALDIFNKELGRSRYNMSIDTVWLYLKMIRQIEKNYQDLNNQMALSASTVLLDLISSRATRYL